MILILTYHKVLRGPEAMAEFYTVRAETLERQLELLGDRGMRELKVKELVKGSIETDPSPRPSPLLKGRGGIVGSPIAREDSTQYASSSPIPFILSFDDGTVDHYEVVMPLLAKAGRLGIFFVPTAKLNRPGYLTSEMVREMARAGHTIGLHGHEHRRLDEFGEEDIRVQMEVSRKMLGELTGAAPVVFAPPGGFMDRRVQAVALETGVRAIRTMRWGYNRRVDLAALECIPLNRHSEEKEFRRVLEFRSQAVAYAMKQVARKVVPAGVYGRLRGAVSRVRGGA